MASIIVASITAVPLVLLIWDLSRNKTKVSADPYAGPARQPIA